MGRTHKNNQGGRPHRAARLDVRLAASELADLRAIAAASGRSVSAYIRWAILYRLTGPVRPCDPAHCPRASEEATHA